VFGGGFVLVLFVFVGGEFGVGKLMLFLMVFVVILCEWCVFFVIGEELMV